MFEDGTPSIGEGSFVVVDSVGAYEGPLTPLFTVERPLVVESIEVDVLPEVVLCEDGERGIPNVGGPVTDGGAFPTPDAALEAFVASPTEGDSRMPRDLFTEMKTPDGSVHYGIPLAAYGEFDERLLAVITVVATSEGWVVTEWHASGC